DQQPAGCRGGAEHGLAGPVSHERKGGKLPLENGHIGNQGRSHVRSSVALAGRHSKTNGSLSIFVGRHGAMSPTDKVRCNIMPIARAYSRVSQPFFLRPHALALLRARRKRPRGCRAAECSQQFPPSDGDCHTPLPCEVRKRNDTTPRACSLDV